MTRARMIIGDTRDVVASLPDNSVDLIVTSPPFLALRSYLPVDHPDKWREIGSEPSPADFLGTLLELTVEWRRVLAPHGSICVELGDTYSGSGGAGGDYNANGLREGQAKFTGSNSRRGKVVDHDSGRRTPSTGWPLAKSLTGIPTLYAWSLACGRNLLAPEQTFEPWRIRNVLVWARNNPPVGALGDKFRPATSYITVACPSDRRWFDLDAVRTKKERPEHTDNRGGHKREGIPGRSAQVANPVDENGKRIQENTEGSPPNDWWTDDDGPNGDRLWWLNTAPYSGSHYATFPAELPARLVQAMCPTRVCTVCGEPSRRITEKSEAYRDHMETKLGRSLAPVGERLNRIDGSRRDSESVTVGWTDCAHDSWRNGVTLDPFGGTGTTGLAATGAGRDAILVDIDQRNADLARDRIGMFLEVEHFRAGAGMKAIL